MPNLKAIRSRIRSVQSTQKITRAMRLVAAAKVRRAQMRVQAARPFTKAVVKILREVVAEVSPSDLQDLVLLQRREVKKVALIVLSSDRGLCGGYNGTVLREALSRIQTLKAEGKEVGLITIGLKAATFFKGVQIKKYHSYTLLPAIPTVEEAKLISEFACELYTNREVDAIEIIGTDFVSMLRSEVVNTKYLPVHMPSVETPERGLHPIRLFEPSVIDVLEKELLPKYVQNVIYQALLEAAASELAARMNAMSNASTNARELINSLTLIYNKARQAAITQELLEIVGGAEALKG